MMKGNVIFVCVAFLLEFSSVDGLICFLDGQGEKNCAAGNICGIKKTDNGDSKFCSSAPVGCVTENGVETCTCNTRGCNENFTKARGESSSSSGGNTQNSNPGTAAGSGSGSSQNFSNNGVEKVHMTKSWIYSTTTFINIFLYFFVL
eukprot:TRINITY_DN4149_c0_g1_i1.p1 TRINITY_DN4149_c0_g1~~TRINITY_DN4149_c0_g1_i1.p1  ORF type:complete len:147 (-),score=25.14 TRINITY_DN4149_c0_g1_i1:100-540(-)